MKRIFHIKGIFKDKGGFSLVEIIIVIAIFSIMSLFVAPGVFNFLSSSRGNFILLTTMITKTFDDSFLNDRLNYLAIHLYEPFEDADADTEDVFSKENGISVVNIDENGKFIESKNKLLKYKEFPDSFRLEEVVLSTGETIHRGNVLIPFYPHGYSDNVILHVLVNDEDQWSVKILKLQKEAEIIPEYVDFDSSPM